MGTDPGRRGFYAYQLCDVPEPARELFGALTVGRLVVIPPTEYTP